MSENLGNDFSTTLNNGGSVSAGATSFVVASSTGAPSVNFRIRVENEIMLVTNVSGTTWTVTRGVEGTTAASHADGLSVVHVVTIGGLAQYLTERYLSLSAGGAVSGRVGFGTSVSTVAQVSVSVVGSDVTNTEYGAYVQLYDSAASGTAAKVAQQCYVQTYTSWGATGGQIIALTGNATHAVAGTLTTARAIYGSVNVTDAGATVTNAQVFVAADSSNSGTITNLSGYFCSDLTKGSSLNAAFYGAVSHGTGKYNLYLTGNAVNYLGGAMGIGGVPTYGQDYFIMAGVLVSASVSFGVRSVVSVDVGCATYYDFLSTPGTQAGSGVTLLVHFSASLGTYGVAPTTIYGFSVSATMGGGTNNYGFHSAMNAAASTYNLYLPGTAQNYMAGSLGIGITTPDTDSRLKIGGSITATGTSAYGVNTGGTITSGITSRAVLYYAKPTTAAAAFTCGIVADFYGDDVTLGGGSAVTLMAAFYGNVASGTGKYNLYMVGTAQNYMAGVTGIGIAASSTAALTLAAGTTAKSSLRITSGVAPTSPTDGDVWYDGTNVKIQVGATTKTFTIT